MTKKSKQGRRPFLLKLLAYDYSYYIDRIVDLEAALAKNPRQLQIDLMGEGEIPADTALLIYSILRQHPVKTRIITNARSSLRGGSVLVWLAGDTRLIRDNARIFFRRMDESEVEEATAETGEHEAPKYADSYSETDPDDADYVRMLQLVNEFLPVKELAGHPIGLPVLRQFGLLENPQLDRWLNTAFEPAKASGSSKSGKAGKKSVRSRAKASVSGTLEK